MMLTWLPPPTLYKALLRDHVSPALRALGFKGSGGRWVFTDSNTGDMAIVQSQSCAYYGDSSSMAEFYINLAVVPAPWWSYIVERDGDHATKTPKEDAASASAAGQDVAMELATTGVPQLLHFLHRPTLLAYLRAMEHSPIFRSEPLAVLLADAGPSAELDEVLDLILADVDAGNYPPVRDHFARRLVDWAREPLRHRRPQL
jgi:hypothetical protein